MKLPPYRNCLYLPLSTINYKEEGIAFFLSFFVLIIRVHSFGDGLL